jgi:hypothetical protein
LIQIRGIGEGKAEKLIAAATHLVNTAVEKDESEDETEDVIEDEAEDVTKDESADVIDGESEDETEDKSDNNET